MGFGEIVVFARSWLSRQQHEVAAQPPRAMEVLGEIGLLGEEVQKQDEVSLADRIQARGSIEADLRQQGWM